MTDNPNVGDYFVQRGAGIFGVVIRAVTRSPVNHTGLLTDSDPAEVVEALSQGVVRNPPPAEVTAWSTGTIKCTPEQAKAAARFAESMIGTPYGWLNVIALGALQYGVRLPYLIRKLQDKNTLFCSQLVDEAFRLAGVQLFDDGRLPMDVTPGDLYNLILKDQS